MDRRELDAMLKLLRRHGVAEFTLDEEDTSFSVKFAGATSAPVVTVSAPASAGPAPAAAPPAPPPGTSGASARPSSGPSTARRPRRRPRT